MAARCDPIKKPIMVIVIYALDECEDQTDVKLILRSLSKLGSSVDAPVRIFITSRPKRPINDGFKSITSVKYYELILDGILLTIVDKDIETFLRHEFKKTTEDESGWAGDGIIKLLINRTKGLFLYAATVCRYLKDDLFSPRNVCKTFSKVLSQAHSLT